MTGVCRLCRSRRCFHCLHDNHPFYVEGIGFVPAGDLQPEDRIMLLDGSSRKIESIEHEFPATSVKVYNFEVEDLHTYYVGVRGVLVHNICPRKGGKYSGTGEYGDVGGHHVHAKAGFKGDVNYDPKKEFSISQQFMEDIAKPIFVFL